MGIKIINKICDSCEFKEISIGDMFLFNGNLYMKTPEVKPVAFNNITCNSVGVEDCRLYFLHDDNDVIPVDATVSISRRGIK